MPSWQWCREEIKEAMPCFAFRLVLSVYSLGGDSITCVCCVDNGMRVVRDVLTLARVGKK